jgi:hypothetical protein
MVMHGVLAEPTRHRSGKRPARQGNRGCAVSSVLELHPKSADGWDHMARLKNSCRRHGQLASVPSLENVTRCLSRRPIPDGSTRVATQGGCTMGRHQIFPPQPSLALHLTLTGLCNVQPSEASLSKQKVCGSMTARDVKSEHEY